MSTEQQYYITEKIKIITSEEAVAVVQFPTSEELKYYTTK